MIVTCHIALNGEFCIFKSFVSVVDESSETKPKQYKCGLSILK